MAGPTEAGSPQPSARSVSELPVLGRSALRIERIETIALRAPLARRFVGSAYSMVNRTTIITRLFEDETFGRVRSPGLPLHVGGFEPTYRPWPSLGQDTDAILAELGYAAGDVARLRTGGAFGDPAGSHGETSAP